ncbi:carbohydrate kinase family protein [Microbacterium halotolerans]|uniref:carbohydrate kinase family protein n=1 Tax=Microbacterium halotolerans TaxID=246613 RepID=UPI0019698E58|nr:carbohydrate kinase family protein [Microbacterium halotolerans]
MQVRGVGDVLVAGHVCVDLVPDFPGEARVEPGALFNVGALGMRVGGSIANTGSALAGLGIPVRAHGLVGDDALGAIARDRLSAIDGVRADLVTTRDHATSYSIVVQPRGEDRSFWHHTGANDAFDGTTLDPAGARLVHLGYPPLLPGIAADGGAPLAATLARVKDANATTSLDLAVVDEASPAGGYDWNAILTEVLPHTDVLTPSLDDLTSALRLAPRTGLADELAEDLLARGAGIVAISAGEEGLLLRAAGAERLARGGPVLRALGAEWAHARVRVEPVPVDRLGTTNGAGDAATAGLLAGLLRAAPPGDAVRLAAWAAADWIESSSCSGARIAARAAGVAPWARG